MKMSLFERLKNKRQDLTEVSDDFTSKQRKDNLNMLNKMFGSEERSKKTARDIKKTLNTSNKKENQRQKRIIKKNTEQGDKLLQDINKRKSADLTRADAINRSMGSSGSTEGAAGAGGTTTQTRTVSQAEVSKKAQDFTKEINKKNKNRTFFDPEKAKEARKNLIAKRKEYGIDRKGNISDAGVERYAQKTKQLSSGSNVPAKITQADKDLAKKRMTDKYGRRLGRKRRSDAKSLDQIKKDIELKPYKDKLKREVKANRANVAQQRTIQKKLRIDKAIARSGESGIKFREAARSVASKIPGLSREVTLPAIGNQPGKKVKALKPIVKKVIQGVQKAGPGGAVVAGAGLALLNPSIRKTAKRVAKVALGAAGVKAFTSKPKLVSRPPTSIGINLSSGKAKSKPSDFALKRQELLKKDPNKVANKNLA